MKWNYQGLLTIGLVSSGITTVLENIDNVVKSLGFSDFWLSSGMTMVPEHNNNVVKWPGFIDIWCNN